MIGPRLWLQVGQLPIKARWRDLPLTLCNLAKAFKHYYIFGFHLPEVIKTITMIHYCYCLMVPWKWRRIIYWKANYIMVLYRNCNWKKRTLMLTFNFWHSKLSKICALIYRNLSCPKKFLPTRLIVYTKIWKVILSKLFVFEKILMEFIFVNIFFETNNSVNFGLNDFLLVLSDNSWKTTTTTKETV